MIRPTRVPSGDSQLPLELGHSPSHAEADFIVGDGNELAFAHILAFPQWAGPLTLVTGPAKSGKSHLARVWVARADARLVEPDEVETLSRQGGDQPLVVEDVDRLDYDEDALFHLLNQSMRDVRPVLMTAREPVAKWPFRTDDLRSRARLAAHFEIHATDDIQLSQMLVKLFGDRQVSVEPRVVSFLVSRMERSAEEAVILAQMLDEMALARGTAITRSLAADVLALRGGAHDDGQLKLNLEGHDDE